MLLLVSLACLQVEAKAAGSENALQGKLASLSQGLFLEGSSPVGLLFLFFAPASCEQFKERLEIALEPFSESMGGTTSLMTIALDKLRYARGIAYAEDQWLPAFGRNSIAARFFSLSCYSSALEAYRAATMAVKEGLVDVSGKASSLDFLVGGSDYVGGAQGALEDYDELVNEIESRKRPSGAYSEGTLGEMITAAQDSAIAAWSSFKNNRAPRMMPSLKEILVPGGVLSNEALLLRKLRDAGDSLYSEIRGLKDGYAKASKEASVELERLRNERLELSDSASFASASGGGVSSASNVTSFSIELRGLDASVKSAAAACGRGNVNEAAQKRGHLGAAVVEYRECVSGITEAGREIVALGKRASELEASLEKTVEDRIRSLKEKISALQGREPLVAAVALQELQRILEQADRDKASQQLGFRIASLSSEIDSLEGVENIARESASVRTETDRLSSKLEWLSKLFEKARGDGFLVGEEEKLLQEAGTALKGVAALSWSGNASKAIELIARDIAAVEDGLFSKAESKVRKAYDRFLALEPFVASGYLSDGRRLDYEGLRNIFSSPAWDSIGRLSGAEALLGEIEREAAVALPLVLAKHLSENAVFTCIPRAVKLNKPSEVECEADIRNGLDFGYDSSLELSYPELPSNAEIVGGDAPSGTIVRNGKIVLSKVDAKAGYRVRIAYNATLASLIDESEETNYANERNAMKTYVIRFNAEREAFVGIERDFGFPISLEMLAVNFNGEAAESVAGSKVRVLAKAVKGVNEIALKLLVREPFEVTKTTSVTDSVVSLGFSVENKLPVPFENADLEFFESMGCSVASVEIIPRGNAAYHAEQGLVSLSLKSDFSGNEVKAFTARVKCDALESVAEAKLEEAEALLTANRDADLAKVVEDAKNAIKRGQLGEAIEKLSEASSGISNALLNATGSDFERTLNDSVTKAISEASEISVLAAEFGEHAGAMKKIAEEARNHAGLAEKALLKPAAAEADREVELAFNALDKLQEIIGAETSAITKACRELANCSSAEEIAAEAGKQLFLRNYASAFKVLSKAKSALAASQKESDSLTAEKKAVFEDYGKLRDAANRAIETFNQVFALPEELVKYRVKSSVETTGRDAVDKAEKTMKRLDGLWAAVQSKASELDKYSLDYLSSLVQDLDASRKAIEDSVRGIGDLAARELSLASERQKQFGTSETQRDLDQAKSNIESSRYFTAYVLANSLNRRMLGAPAEGGADYTSVVFAVAGLGVLAFLAWLFSRPQGRALKEI
jgi:hypothetical protein